MSWACCFGGHPIQPMESSYNRSVQTPRVNEAFFVITAIFNPASFQNRYNLYHKFAKHMKDCGAQLITIECIFPSLNQHQFQVTDSNNPNHIQLKSKSIYWMKENLINIAVSRLPSHAKWICWLDADIYFDEHNKNWIDRTIELLKKYTIVQIFEKANFLSPHDEILRVDYSFGYSVVHNKIIDQDRYDEWYPHPGYGWAMEKNTFLKIHGLPEYDIVGSGDLHFAFSLLNRVSKTIEQDLNENFKQYIMDQSKEMFMTLNEITRNESKSLIGYVPVTINHNWHGSRKDRQYVNRWKILIAHNFNFLTDMTKTSVGLLEFVDSPLGRSGPNKLSLQDDVIVHFGLRNEDEIELNDEDLKSTSNKSKGPVIVGVGKPKVGGRKKYHAPPVPSFSGHSGGTTSNNDFLTNAAILSAFQGESNDQYLNHHDNQNENPEETSVCDNYGNDYNGTIECTTHY